MNTKNIHRTVAAHVPRAIALAALLASTPLLSAADVERAGSPRAGNVTATARIVGFDTDDSSRSRSFTVLGDPEGSDIDVWADGHSISMQIKDGEVTVTLDGEEISADRVVQEDGRITILDEDGNEIESIMIGGGGTGMTFGLRERGGLFGGPGAVITLEEPKVMLGIHLGEPGLALEKHLELEPGTTTMITALYEGLPAHAAGLGEFDIIVEIDGKRPADPKSLRDALAAGEPGDSLTFDVIQSGERRRTKVKLDAYDRGVMETAKLIGRPPDRVLDWQFEGEPGAMPRTLGPGLRDFLQRRPEMNDVFIDGNDNVFEVLPGDRSRVRIRDRDIAPDGNALPPRARPGGDIDDRLGTLDDRLEALERMLDELLERAREGRGGK